MATLKDISQKTGISTSSISRVLNNDETLNISSSKKQLIIQVAEELNYKTINVRKQTEGKILIVSTLSEQQELNDPYYLSIRNGAENYCIEKKQKFQSTYINNIETLDLEKYLGIIVIGNLEEKYLKLADKYVNKLVFVDTNANNLDFNCVTVDLQYITKIAIEKLIDNGCENIMYVGPFEENGDYDLRYTNFRNYISLYKKNGYYLESDFGTISTYNKLINFEHINELDGIVCANDNIAIGVLKYLSELNINVPQDIQVIGVNDIPVAKSSKPALTTVKIHAEYMGEVSVRRVLELALNKSEHRINYVVHSKLVERETTI